MKRFLLATTAMLGLVGMSACDKPTADDCKAAIENMQKLLGTNATSQAEANLGEIRRCKGGSKREAVACAKAATTLDQLKACQFMTKPAAAK